MLFSRKTLVSVTSACVVCVCVCVCVCEGGEMKQEVNLCDGAEYELNNYDRLILPSNVTERL